MTTVTLSDQVQGLLVQFDALGPQIQEAFDARPYDGKRIEHLMNERHGVMAEIVGYVEYAVKRSLVEQAV